MMGECRAGCVRGLRHESRGNILLCRGSERLHLEGVPDDEIGR